MRARARARTPPRPCNLARTRVRARSFAFIKSYARERRRALDAPRALARRRTRNKLQSWKDDGTRMHQRRVHGPAAASRWLTLTTTRKRVTRTRACTVERQPVCVSSRDGGWSTWRMRRGAVGRPVRRHMGQRHTGLAADDAKTHGLPQPSDSRLAVSAECHNTRSFSSMTIRAGLARARETYARFIHAPSRGALSISRPIDSTRCARSWRLGCFRLRPSSFVDVVLSLFIVIARNSRNPCARARAVVLAQAFSALFLVNFPRSGPFEPLARADFCLPGLSRFPADIASVRGIIFYANTLDHSSACEYRFLRGSLS